MRRAVAAAMVLMLTASAAAAQAACTATPGEHVLLKSGTIDPDVFVWDLKPLMIAYASGIWPGTKDVLRHTLLTSPGTIGIVLACQSGAIHPNAVPLTQDAVGIRITTGPYNGRSGWVASNDVHPLRPAHK